MRRFIDLTNQKFGRLTALYRLHNTDGKTKWLCICECGNLAETSLSHLRNGGAKSCGCLHKEMMIQTFTKHNKSNTRLYNIWQGMKKRCYNINDEAYKYYGGRGIKVCNEWLNDFQAFYDWAMNNDYKENLTIDRIDVDTDYKPGNCRWATNKDQQRNKRSNNYYTINGETHCLKEWCEILNLNYYTVHNRIVRYSWPIEKALELEDIND